MYSQDFSLQFVSIEYFPILLSYALNTGTVTLAQWRMYFWELWSNQNLLERDSQNYS